VAYLVNGVTFDALEWPRDPDFKRRAGLSATARLSYLHDDRLHRQAVDSDKLLVSDTDTKSAEVEPLIRRLHAMTRRPEWRRQNVVTARSFPGQ